MTVLEPYEDKSTQLKATKESLELLVKHAKKLGHLATLKAIASSAISEAATERSKTVDQEQNKILMIVLEELRMI